MKQCCANCRNCRGLETYKYNVSVDDIEDTCDFACDTYLTDNIVRFVDTDICEFKCKNYIRSEFTLCSDKLPEFDSPCIVRFRNGFETRLQYKADENCWSWFASIEDDKGNVFASDWVKWEETSKSDEIVSWKPIIDTDNIIHELIRKL